MEVIGAKEGDVQSEQEPNSVESLVVGDDGVHGKDGAPDDDDAGGEGSERESLEEVDGRKLCEEESCVKET